MIQKCGDEPSLTYYSKQLFSAVHNFVHLNLAIALLVGYLVFAVGVELAHKNKVTMHDILFCPECIMIVDVLHL